MLSTRECWSSLFTCGIIRGQTSHGRAWSQCWQICLRNGSMTGNSMKTTVQMPTCQSIPVFTWVLYQSRVDVMNERNTFPSASMNSGGIPPLHNLSIYFHSSRVCSRDPQNATIPHGWSAQRLLINTSHISISSPQVENLVAHLATEGERLGLKSSKSKPRLENTAPVLPIVFEV